MRAVVAILLLLGAMGCSSKYVYEGREQVTRDQLGSRWPLTVDAGELRCEGRIGQRTASIRVDGREYALSARTEGSGAAEPIDPIWALNPATPGFPRDLRPLLERALALCEPDAPGQQ